MARPVVFLLLPLLSLVTLSRAQVPEQGTAILTVPHTITKPGTYVLRRDVVYKAGSGAAITIKANHVTLDLGGRSISYMPGPNVPAGTGEATGVLSAGFNDLIVRHGSLFDFKTGVSLSPGATPGRLLVEKVECDGSVSRGIEVVSGDFAEVRDCRIRNTGAVDATSVVFGIDVTAKFCSIVGNEVVETLAVGLNARPIESTGLASLISHNHVINSTLIATSYGIMISGSNSSPTNAENFAIDNSIAGFAVGLGFVNNAAGRYRDNLTSNCSTPFQGGTAAGSNN